jgi:hypothetical protein
MIQEKGDATELVLDGHLLGEHQSKVNLAELLHIAQKEFSRTGEQTIDESSLEEDWPNLRLLLGRAMQSWSVGIVGCSTAAACPMEVILVKPNEMMAKKLVHNRSNDLFENVSAVKEIKQPNSDSSLFDEMPLWKQAFRPRRN